MWSRCVSKNIFTYVSHQNQQIHESDALSLYKGPLSVSFSSSELAHPSQPCPPPRKLHLNTSPSIPSTWPITLNASSKLPLLPWTLRRSLNYLKSLRRILVCPSAQLRILQRVRLHSLIDRVPGADRVLPSDTDVRVKA